MADASRVGRSQQQQAAVLHCNSISTLVHSKHKCNQQKCRSKKSRQKLHTFSTKTRNDLEICLALKHMKNKEVVKKRLVTSRSAAEVESAFGCTEFELCSDMLELVNQKLHPSGQKENTPAAAGIFPAHHLAVEQNYNLGGDEEKSDNSDLDKVVSILTTPPDGHSIHSISTAGSSQYTTEQTSTISETRQSHKEVFYETYKNVEALLPELNRQKCVTQLMRQYYDSICNTSLCHLLCLTGYNSNT